MKRIKLAALAGVSLLAMTIPALSDPVSIGSFVISSLLSVGGAGLLPAVSAAAIGNFVLGAAVIGANILTSALNRPPKVNPGEYKNVFETGESSELRAVGRVRIGGLKAFGNTIGLDRYRVIAHTKGVWTATEEHFLGGREVTVDPDGSVSSPPWTRPGGSYVYVLAKPGDGTETAWPQLISAFPDLWSPDHRVRGIAQSLVHYISPGLENEKFLKLYQSGEPPYERVGRAEPVYDPRSGHSATNPATWAWRDNGVLCAAHILRTYPSIRADDLDYVLISTEATKADTTVSTLAGSEPLSRCWGVWPSERPRGDMMQQVLESIGAEIIPTPDNQYTIRLVDDVRVPEISFTARDIIDLDWKSGPESVERPNVCRIEYYSPERNYEMAEIDLSSVSWARVQDEIDRVGEQFFDLKLPFCPSASQAQRIGRRLFALARADAGIVKTNFVGLAAWGKSVAEIEFPELDETAICAIANPRINDEDGTVEIPFVVWPDLPPWNPATMEAPAPDPIPDLQYPSTLATPVVSPEATVVQYPSTVYEFRARMTPVPGAAIAEGTFRTYSGGNPDPWQGMSEPSLATAYAAIAGAGQQIDFRYRYFDVEEEGSYFSPVLEYVGAIKNATPDAPTELGGTTYSTANLWVSSLRAETKVTPASPSPPGDWEPLAIEPVAPWINVTFSPPNPGSGGTVEMRVYCRTSNGTEGPFAYYTFTAPVDGA